jgi:hypothetical protein
VPANATRSIELLVEPEHLPELICLGFNTSKSL